MSNSVADNDKGCKIIKMRKRINIRVNSRIQVQIINYYNPSNSKINTQNLHVSQLFKFKVTLCLGNDPSRCVL